MRQRYSCISLMSPSVCVFPHGPVPHTDTIEPPSVGPDTGKIARMEGST